MTDLKTTISGAVFILAFVCKTFFKTDIPVEVINAIEAIAGFMVGWFAKDNTTKTPTP